LAVRCNVQKSRPSSIVKVKAQGHQGQKNALSAADTPGAYEWYALAANSVQQQQRMGPFRGCQGCFLGLVCATSVLGDAVLRQFYAGGKISACCLVVVTVRRAVVSLLELCCPDESVPNFCRAVILFEW